MSESGLMPDGPEDVGLPDGSDAALALDFALGSLDGAAVREADLRLRRDPDFARDVARWQADLAPLADTVVPVAPPPVVWAAIERDLFRTSTTAAAMPAPSHALQGALGLWRRLAFGASAVAAVALALLVLRPAPQPVIVHVPIRVPVAAPLGGLLAASMASPAGGKAVLVTATYDPARGTVILTPAAADASKGRSPELWLIVGKEPPRSLGLIDFKGAQAHPIPAALRARFGEGVTLAISLEPAGGSPTGAPTGPVVAAGQLAAI